MSVEFVDDAHLQDPAGTAPPPEGAGDAVVDAEDTAVDIDELIAWVHDTVLPLYQRSLLKGATWCPAWFEHPEAVFRFEVLRRAWEEAVVADEGSAMSTWTLHHLDPHMGVLLSPQGPFAECEYTERHGFRHNDGHASRLMLPSMDLAQRQQQHEQRQQ